jgi:hypothetical protein
VPNCGTCDCETEMVPECPSQVATKPLIRCGVMASDAKVTVETYANVPTVSNIIVGLVKSANLTIGAWKNELRKIKVKT